MKVPSKKKIAITAFAIAALGLLTLVAILVAVGMTSRPTVPLSVDDVAEIKTLVYKYLNERSRIMVSSNPANNPNIASAPVIDPSDMSPGLAARQAEDVEKLRAMGGLGTFDSFATFAQVLDIREKGDTAVLDIGSTTYFRNVSKAPDGNADIWSSAGAERLFTFTRMGTRWILTDAKLSSAGTMPPPEEPSVKPGEVGGPRVLENPIPFRRSDDVPEKIEELDKAATRKIANKWVVIDREMAVSLAEKHSEQLSDLIALAAHELRHPATIFRTYTNILLDSSGQLDDETVRDALLAIDEATDRLTGMATKLLEASNSEQGELEPRPIAIAPRSIVVRAVEDIRIGDVDIDFNINIPEHEEVVVVDPDLITTALTMLLENAVKFSTVGGSIDISVRQSAGDTIFAVADRGEGVPEADREMIFERLYQVDDVMHHSKPGLGLGLHIAKEIITAHKGWIKHEPRSGGGSVFSFCIPQEFESR